VLDRICCEAGCGQVDGDSIVVASAVFDVANRAIVGAVSDESERVREQLRRHGIRFRFAPEGGRYSPWGR
jgi:SOS-response transcriptional repressor LexA